MILTDFNQPNVYPFTVDSTRILYGNYKLPAGLVYGAVLYPQATEPLSLHISNIHTKPIPYTTELQHIWTVADSANTVVLEILFTTKSDTLPAGLTKTGPSTGYAIQNDHCCGVVRCASDFMAFAQMLPDDLDLPATALVFDPTVVCIQRPTGFRGLVIDDTTVTKIEFDPSVFTVSDNSISVNTTTGVTTTQRPVKTLKVIDANSIVSDEITGESIALTSDIGSSMKVVTTKDTIQIGRAMDFL